jgi:hypothetical protein
MNPHLKDCPNDLWGVQEQKQNLLRTHRPEANKVNLDTGLVRLTSIFKKEEGDI